MKYSAFTPLFLSAVVLTEGAKIICKDEEECDGQTLEAQNVLCSGYLACQNADITTSRLDLTGYLAMGEDPEANIEASIDADVMFVSGKSGLRGITTKLAKKNYFLGDVSGYDGVFHTDGLDDVYVEIHGNYAVRGAIFTCSSGSTCKFVCGDCGEAVFISEANANLSVECLYKDYSCGDVKIYHQGDELCVTGADIGSATLSLEAPGRRLGNLPMSKREEELQRREEERQVVEIARPRNLVEHLYCSNDKECANQELNGENFDELVCQGSSACQNARILNLVSSTYCYGSLSCAEASIYTEEERVYCEGDRACLGAEITAITMYVEGYRSNQNGLLRAGKSQWSSTVYAKGYQAFHNGLYICPSEVDCEIRCQGIDSCKGATIDFSAVVDGQDYDFECEDHSSCSEADGVTIVEPCFHHNDDLAACNKDKFCVSYEGECKAKSEFCTGTSRSECLGNGKGKTCRWHKGSCKLKTNQMPRVYKKFDFFK